MHTDTISRRLSGTPLQRRQANDMQMKQRSGLAIGLGMAVMAFILLSTAACGSSDGSLAQSGLNLVVVSGQGQILQSGGGNASVVEGQEAVVTTGDQITAGEAGAGLELLLANGSLLYLNPGTDLRVVTFSTEGAVRLSQLKGRLEVEAASPLLTVEISISIYEGFAEKKMQFTATPTVRDTAFQLGIDGVNAHLAVESGEVKATHNDLTETIPAGGEVTASPGGVWTVKKQPVTPTVAAVGPTTTPGLTSPTPTATATPIPAPTYPPPGLVGPDDGSEFRVDDTILLMWDTPTPLSADEWYEVQLWREGDVPYTVVQRTREGTWKVEPRYYPGRYQWRILIVRSSQEGQREVLSPPSETRRFSWLQPPVQVSKTPTSPSFSGVSVDLTVYLKGTNNAPGYATFSGEKVNAGTIYNEGGTVYGDVAVRIGETVYHFDKPKPAPGEPEQLPDPYRVEFKFSDSLLAAAEGMQPGSDPKKAQFWVGTLNCNSATPPDKPYQIEVILYAGGEAKKHTEVSFLVADDPSCGGGGTEPGGGGGDAGPTPHRP